MNVFDLMLARYEIISENDHRNAILEVMQKITLAGLYRCGFFDKAASNGGAVQNCIYFGYGSCRFIGGKFLDLKYQADAIQMSLATIENHNVVIISDVV